MPAELLDARTGYLVNPHRLRANLRRNSVPLVETRKQFFGSCAVSSGYLHRRESQFLIDCYQLKRGRGTPYWLRRGNPQVLLLGHEFPAAIDFRVLNAGANGELRLRPQE